MKLKTVKISRLKPHKDRPHLNPNGLSRNEQNPSKSLSRQTMHKFQGKGPKYYLLEIDPNYCDVIINRWQNFTGKKAELINT